MAKLTEGTWVEDPQTGGPKYLAEGSDLPTWAADQVGDHLLDGDGDGAADEPTPYAKQTVAALEKAILVRNNGRDAADVIDPESGKKSDLIAALEADDAKQASADGGTGDGATTTEDGAGTGAASPADKAAQTGDGSGS